MKKKVKETRQVYIIIDKENNHFVRKYLSKVESLTGVLKATLSKHFQKYKTPYQYEGYLIHKCNNVDLKGYYKNNFR